jgi:hypothetical protein
MVFRIEQVRDVKKREQGPETHLEIVTAGGEVGNDGH